MSMDRWESLAKEAHIVSQERKIAIRHINSDNSIPELIQRILINSYINRVTAEEPEVE